MRNNGLILQYHRECILNEDCTCAAPSRFSNKQPLFFNLFLLFAFPCQKLIPKAKNYKIEAF